MLINNLENEMVNTLNNLSKITLYDHGRPTQYTHNDKKFKVVFNNLQELFHCARVLPALGVSLDNLVKEELKNDCWIELEFQKEQEINGLPFNKLLIKLEECYGCNLIRQYQNSYDGRCIYVDFDDLKNLKQLLM